MKTVDASHLPSGQNKGFAQTTSPEAFLMGTDNRFGGYFLLCRLKKADSEKLLRIILHLKGFLLFRCSKLK